MGRKVEYEKKNPPAEDQRRPVIGAAEQPEDPRHGHDEVKMGDDEEGVVQVFVEDGLREDRAAESAGHEQRNEAKSEEHGRRKTWARAPHRCQPAEHLGRRRQRNGERGRAEHGTGVVAIMSRYAKTGRRAKFASTIDVSPMPGRIAMYTSG